MEATKYITLDAKAKDYAIAAHAAVNHLYDGHPYSAHLQMVEGIAQRFLNDAIPEAMHQAVLAACWAHDLIEDARLTYNDVKTTLGPIVAEIVYALTNEKGRTRAERANERYYNGIIITPFAPFVKCCDRAANIRYSLHSQSRMLKVYLAEHEEFCAKLYRPALNPLLTYMNKMLYEKIDEC